MEAAKYEELEEMKKQLALIELDSTRTKDAKELRTKIADMEKEIANDSLQDQVDAQVEAIDDQTEALDDYVTQHEEDLQEMLENAQNFAGEVDKVMKMNQQDLIDWLKRNDEQYKNSLDSTRESIEKGWKDTWDQMTGTVATHWDEIAKAMKSKEGFLTFMQNNSEEYKNASKADQERMRREWIEAYNNWTASQDTSGEAGHTDNNSDNGSGTKHGYKFKFKGETYKDEGYASKKAAKEAAKEALRAAYNLKNDDLLSKYGAGTTKYEQKHAELLEAKRAVKITAYREGGVVDFTGPAWVDGTPTRPEAFLNPDDTVMIRGLLDSLKYTTASISMTPIGNEMFGGTRSSSIGDVHIQINEAKFENDADYEEVARRVGDAFTKELAKQGFGTANYNF